MRITNQDQPDPRGLQPTNPYHVARVYGVKASSPVATNPNPDAAHNSGGGAARLVAGIVPGGVDFTADGAASPSTGALPMYRHPADKNAAATAVSVGRSLDVRG